MKITLIDLIPIIAAVIGLIGVLVAAYMTITKKTKPFWITLLILGIILLIVGIIYFPWSTFWPSTEVKITSPQDGAIVETIETVKGTSQKVSEQALWVVVYPLIADRYYPQKNPADIQPNGNWASPTFIGINENAGNKFDILAVIANKSAQDTFNNYLKEAEIKKSWPGLEKLPKGTIIYDRITIKVKPEGSTVSKVNINTASVNDLEVLPGIGETIAKRIVAKREADGPFKNIEELKDVEGIGPKRFEEIKDLVTVS